MMKITRKCHLKHMVMFSGFSSLCLPHSSLSQRGSSVTSDALSLIIMISASLSCSQVSPLPSPCPPIKHLFLFDPYLWSNQRMSSNPSNFLSDKYLTSWPLFCHFFPSTLSWWAFSVESVGTGLPEDTMVSQVVMDAGKILDNFHKIIMIFVLWFRKRLLQAKCPS